MSPTDPLAASNVSLPRFGRGSFGEVDRPSFQSNSGGQPRRLLLVESIRSTRELLGVALEEQYQVESVATYEEALRRARSVQFDAVLLSVSRGRFHSGLQTLQEIREIDGYDETPLLVVTGPNLREEQPRLRQAGGDAFLEMPFVQSELLDLLGRFLGS